MAGRSRVYTGQPVQSASLFLSEHKSLFALDSVNGWMDPAQRVIRQQQLPGATKITYEQTAGGFPIVDAQIGVVVEASGSIVHVASTAQQIPAIDTIPAISAGMAIARSLSVLGNPHFLGTDQAPHLVIYPFPPSLGYEIYLTVDADYPEPWRFVIDAHDGAVLLQRRLVQDAGDSSRVFDPNPVTTLNDESLRDHGDSNTAVPPAVYFPVVLKHLDPPVGELYSLKGAYAWMRNIESPSNTPPTSPDSAFSFLRADDGFEEVMVYYTIDKNQTYIQSLGFTSIDNRQHSFDAHGYNGADNSHYVGSPIGAGYITYGDGGVDDAEDADIILHEYGHSIQDNSTQGIYFGVANNGYGDETGAMGEGFGDYWAASAGNDSSLAHAFPPAYVGEWDAKAYSPSGDPYLRVVNSAKVYPADMVHEVHSDGEIWSAALWGILQATGRTVTDRIVLYSHFLVPNNPDFADGANAILAADAALYPAPAKSATIVYGIHHNEICAAMSAHGILNCPPLCDCSHHGDPTGDGAFNVFDVLFTIGEAFNNGPAAPKDFFCPHLSRSDYNCDRVINVYDILYAIDFIFSNGPAPCDPCAL